MPIRIVTTHLEFEGQVYEQRVVLEGDEPPVWGPDAELRVVGTATPRVDGRERVSGAANYSHDMQLARACSSPSGCARPIRTRASCGVDVSRAEGMPGVRAILTRFSDARLSIDPSAPARQSSARRCCFTGMEVAVVVAETREQARDALGAIDGGPTSRCPSWSIQRRRCARTRPVSTPEANNNASEEYPKTYERGDVEAALRSAEATSRSRFETPAAPHNSLETHGGVASWDGRTLTV